MFFLILQFFVFLGNYNSERYDVFFWFCNHTPLFFGLAFIFKKTDIIKGLINVGFLGQFIWTLDFFSKIFFDTHIFKMTMYVFEDPNGLWVLLPIGIHIFSTNVALYHTYKNETTSDSLLISLLYILFLYFSTILFTIEENNINWVFKIGAIINISFDYYTSLWPAMVFFLLVIPTYIIQKILYKNI